ncbi:MAG TPA: UvrD-helicase domain-containing protein [Solirubrobacterales bacterium]|nr:UvrD-helicase domain-containing protein [Solirubrobacterales bacterium]
MSASSGQLSLIELAEPGPERRRPDGPERTHEQRTAVEARKRDAFLEAGAGSGKTTVLVDRYCAAVTEDGAAVEAILAFTFTERAAAEMRTRVRRELAARAASARDVGELELAAELKAAARATERAWVMTIHAFCRRLLASHPLAAGLDPRFRVLDAAEAARLRDRAANAALDELLAGGDERVARAAAAYQPWRLTSMTVTAHERLRSQGIAEPQLPPAPDPCHSPAAGQEARELTPAEVEDAAAAREAIERLLEGFHARYEALKEERSALDFQDLELRALALLRGSSAVATAWRGRFTHLLVDEFQDTNRVQLELVDALRGDGTRVFMVGDENQSIYRFRNADLEVFREQRRVALEAPDRDVLPLRGNFRSLPAVLAGVNFVGRTLLDGFAELSAGRAPSSGAGEVELLLTLDEGRGAEARKWDAAGIDLDPPPTGSGKRVVAEARFLAQRLRQLVDTGEAERGDIVVLLRAFTHVDAYEEALERAGLRPFVIGGRGYWTQQQVEDMVRLLGVVSNPLDDEYLFGTLASFAVGVSPDALWLLRRAADPEEGAHRHVWPALAAAYGDAEKPQRWSPEWLDHLPAEDEQRLRRFCGILRALRAEAPLLSLEELIERTMGVFGYDLGLIARRGGVGRMANLRKLMRLAREYERNEGRDLAGFLALAAESAKRDEREGMAAVQAEGHDGVRVMTVHAAKGLQFPVVAVPDLGRRLNAGHSSGDLVIGPAPDGDAANRFGMRLRFPAGTPLGLWELIDLNAQENEATAEEACRLVYVAASRAEDRLILSGVFRTDELEPAQERKPSDTPLRRLLPALADRGWSGGSDAVALPGPMPIEGPLPLPDATLRVRVSEPSPERAAELRRDYPPPPEPDPLGEPAPPPLVDGRPAFVPIGHLSYSALSLYERCGYRFYVERVLGARESAATPPGEEPRASDEVAPPSPTREVALGIGNAVHHALEWSARRSWGRPDDGTLEALLLAEGLACDRAAGERVRSLVDGWLRSPLLAEIRAGGARAEVPFSLPIGRTVVRGQIDLLIASDELPIVVDYKTDALDGAAPAELTERYRAQREVYALAAAGEHGARVVHVFLEAPDQPVDELVDGPGLERARGRLEALIGEMRGGRFEPTSEASPAICFGCAAAAVLCPNARWKPARP